MNKSNQVPDTEVLESINLNKILLPILLGLGVVLWLMWRQLDWDELARIPLTGFTLFWIFLAVLMYLIRHLFYAWRLRVMTSGDFKFWKSMELIVIWEFASSVSPTSIGGSAVALFLLAQEKISGAKTVAVVLYSMVLDTIFFIVSLPLLYILIGPRIIRPGMNSITDIDGYGYTFFAVVLFMASYGAVFAYGLFYKPVGLKRLLLWLSKVKILGRFKQDLRRTALDVVTTSKEISNKPWSFHAYSMIATTGAWVARFLALNCIILALVAATPQDFLSQLLIYARSETMHAITAFSPTPGGAGVAEYLFGGFFSDYIPSGISTVIAFVWRLITYYPYLIAGAIIIPVWVREVAIRKKQEKALQGF